MLQISFPRSALGSSSWYTRASLCWCYLPAPYLETLPILIMKCWETESLQLTLTDHFCNYCNGNVVCVTFVVICFQLNSVVKLQYTHWQLARASRTPSRLRRTQCRQPLCLPEEDPPRLIMKQLCILSGSWGVIKTRPDTRVISADTLKGKRHTVHGANLRKIKKSLLYARKRVEVKHRSRVVQYSDKMNSRQMKCHKNHIW